MKDQRRLDPSLRSGPEERAYLLRRAEDHRRLAEKTEEMVAKAIHLRLMSLYQERAELATW